MVVSTVVLVVVAVVAVGVVVAVVAVVEVVAMSTVVDEAKKSGRGPLACTPASVFESFS